MRTREEMKEEFKRWMLKNPKMSGARVLIDMSRSGKYSDDEMELYTLDDLSEVTETVKRAVFLNKRFEHIMSFIESIQSSKECYEEGLITMLTFVSQVDFNIVKLDKEAPKLKP